MFAVRGGRRRAPHVRGIRSGIDFGEGERRDRSLGEARKIFALLFLGAEQLEWLRDSNRLVSRQQRCKRSILGCHHLDRADVAHLRQTEPAVLLRNLDPERAHVAQFLNERLRQLTSAVYLFGVDALHKRAQLVHERLGARFFRRIRRRMWMDEIEAKAAEVELPDEARMSPLGFARALRYVARFLFARRTDRDVAHVRLRKNTSPIIEIAANENHWIA